MGSTALWVDKARQGGCMSPSLGGSPAFTLIVQIMLWVFILLETQLYWTKAESYINTYGTSEDERKALKTGASGEKSTYNMTNIAGIKEPDPRSKSEGPERV